MKRKAESVSADASKAAEDILRMAAEDPSDLDEEDSEEDNEEEEVEEGEGGGDGKDAMEGVEGSSSRQKQEEVLPPEELQRLQENKLLFKSNLFKLQMDELLSEVSLKGKTKVVTTVLHSLKEVINKLPTIKLKGEFKNVVLHNDVAALKMEFRKPESIDLVGSFLLGTTAKPALNVDVAVKIPSSCLEASDIKDWKYLDKRAIYIATLGKELAKSPQFKNLTFTCFCHDPLKPVLLIRPAKDQKTNATTKFVIRIIPYIAENTFKLANLLPDKSNLGSDSSVPTPCYNTRILEDMLLLHHLKKLHNHIEDNQEVKDVIILLKVWLRQRNMHLINDSFNNFLLSMLIVHLIEMKRVSRRLTAYQIFKLALQFIGEINLSTGIFMNSAVQLKKESFLNNFDFCFVDSHGLNMCARVSKDAFHEFQREALASLHLANDELFDGFDFLFITRQNPHLHYDSYIRILNLDSFKEESLEGDRPWTSKPREQLKKLVGQALSQNRIQENGLRLVSHQQFEWKLNEVAPIEGDTILLGLRLDLAKARSVIDLGPSGDDKEEAERFKAFWRDKAQLRRFQDAQVLWTAVWECEESKRDYIILWIVQHILFHHMNIAPEQVQLVGYQFNHVLGTLVEPSGQLNTPTIIQTFDFLMKKLKQLKDLPLVVKSVLPISPGFRYTAVFPVSTTGKAKQVQALVEPLEAVIVFEQSSRWPLDDYEAMQNVKAAFFLKISQMLKQRNGFECTATKTFVQISGAKLGGFVFRLYIRVHKEVERIPSPADREIFQLKFCDLPPHSSMIHGLQHSYPAFSMTVRLALRWLHSHMFSNYFSHESIELLVAYLFTHPRPYQVPSSHFVGFFRFLHLLANFDFENSPIIVDVNKELTVEMQNQINKQFEQTRKDTPHLYSIYIATVPNPTSVWTKDHFTKIVLNRMIGFARRSCDLISELMDSSMEGKQDLSAWEQLFHTPLEEYDVLINLKKSKVPNYEQNLSAKITRRDTKGSSHYGLNPVACYVRDLKNQYDENALFFYDALGGTCVGVVWKPTALYPKPFQFSSECLNTKPQQEQPNKKFKLLIRLNIDQVIEDFKQLGEGLLQNVKIKEDPLIEQ